MALTPSSWPALQHALLDIVEPGNADLADDADLRCILAKGTLKRPSADGRRTAQRQAPLMTVRLEIPCM